MSIHPDSSFPLLASDQADVIQIFLELMSQGDRSWRASEVTTSHPAGPYGDINESWFQGELPDLE